MNAENAPEPAQPATLSAALPDPPPSDSVLQTHHTAMLMATTGLDEDRLEGLVRAFYVRVRSDDLLAPIFWAAVEDWELHLQQMAAFWSSVSLITGRYRGRPMEKHLALAIGPEHFQRWLDLFRDTAGQLLPPTGASHVIAKAEQIGSAFQARRGNGATPGQASLQPPDPPQGL